MAHRPSSGRVTSAKIVIAGGFGVGKTTLVGSVSEITPLTTEAIMTSAGEGVDDPRQVPGKVPTTVAMHFGRISIDRDLILYLYGTPGQTRFWFMWDELVRGAIGAVVMVDTRRLADCFAAIDFFEHRRLPYLVAINCFDGVQYHGAQDVRDALAIPADIPVVSCDARSRESTKQVLISLVEYVLTMRRQGAGEQVHRVGRVHAQAGEPAVGAAVAVEEVPLGRPCRGVHGQRVAAEDLRPDHIAVRHGLSVFRRQGLVGGSTGVEEQLAGGVPGAAHGPGGQAGDR